jgi:hypothetical protein
VPLVNQDLNCPSFKGVDELYFRAWAELNIDIQAAAGVTIIVSEVRQPAALADTCRAPSATSGVLKSPARGSVPTEESMLHYTSKLRPRYLSTQGRSSYSVSPAHLVPLPKLVANRPHQVPITLAPVFVFLALSPSDPIFASWDQSLVTPH